MRIEPYDQKTPATTLSTGRYRFHVGHVPEGEEGRKEYGGPKVPGPWAYAFGLCTVIDNHGGTGLDIAKDKAAGLWLDVADGDEIEVAGHDYTVRFKNTRGEHIDLVPFEDECKCPECGGLKKMDLDKCVPCTFEDLAGGAS